MRRQYRRKEHKPVEEKPRAPLPPPTVEGFIDIAQRSTKVLELKMLWRSARESSCLTPELKQFLTKRAKELGASILRDSA